MPPQTRSLSKRKRKRTQSMDQNDSTLLLNDFVSLPIIISDYDAINDNKRRASGSTTQESIATADTRTSSGCSSDSSPKPKWTTGFSEFADELWVRMTGSMKQRLRDACVEVLKQTDDEKEPSGDRWGDHDDNARLLD